MSTLLGADCGDDNPWCLLASSMKRITAILEFARNVRLLPKYFALRKYGSTSVRRLRDDVYKIPKLSSVECNTYWRAIALTHLRVRCALRRDACECLAQQCVRRRALHMRCIARLVLRLARGTADGHEHVLCSVVCMTCVCVLCVC